MEAFLDFNKQIPTHIFGSFFVKPTQGCHKTVTAWRRSRTPQSISTGLCQHQRHGGPCCLVVLPLLAGHTILMVTQAKGLLKTEARLPKSS